MDGTIVLIRPTGADRVSPSSTRTTPYSAGGRPAWQELLHAGHHVGCPGTLAGKKAQAAVGEAAIPVPGAAGGLPAYLATPDRSAPWPGVVVMARHQALATA